MDYYGNEFFGGGGYLKLILFFNPSLKVKQTKFYHHFESLNTIKMAKKNEEQTLIQEFATLLIQLPIDLIDGALMAMEDEDGKIVIKAYSEPFKLQFANISAIILENEKNYLLKKKKKQKNY